jgi:hypothetical protein
VEGSSCGLIVLHMFREAEENYKRSHSEYMVSWLISELGPSFMEGRNVTA